MKVVYIVLSPAVGLYHLINKILPQLEEGRHGSEIVGICFFDDNARIFQLDDPYRHRLIVAAKANNIVLMTADSKQLVRNRVNPNSTIGCTKDQVRLRPSECTVVTIEGREEAGCFPDLYAACADNLPDHIISL